MQDVMLDLETMGNGPTAAIIAIGAVEFDLQKQALGDKFYVVVDLASAVAAGGVMDASTVLWWMQQSDEARAAFKVQGSLIKEALERVAGWFKTHNIERVWGNGAAFDNVILGSAYRAQGMTVPWKFWNDRCYRTIKSLHPGIKMKRAGVHHNALDDAITQAEHLMEILNG